MEKAKRFYIAVNNVKACNGYSDYNKAISKFNTKLRAAPADTRISFMVLTDKRTTVELFTNHVQA